MKKRILIALLSIGTIAGFGSGFASLARHRCEHRQSFERHVAQLCAEAARDSAPSR